jgi:[protein-PII] uridylyltransferase
VFTRSDGIVLDEFSIVDARTGNLAGPEQRQKFQDGLRRALTGADLDFRPLIARHKNTRPRYQAYTGERLPTEVRFDNESSDQRTIIEIETEDRIGLLYSISQALTEFSLDISGAKISTENGAAIDSFYVRELDARKLTGQDRQRAIQNKLRAAIAKLE